ncbi:hypothetical protein AB0I37_03825 [Micromonospora purpureochromogenes]
MIHVNDHPTALSAVVQVDTAYLSRDDMAALLRQMEAMVLDSALDE